MQTLCVYQTSNKTYPHRLMHHDMAEMTAVTGADGIFVSHLSIVSKENNKQASTMKEQKKTRNRQQLNFMQILGAMNAEG